MENSAHARKSVLQTILRPPNSIPSNDTFNRLFHSAFTEMFTQWTQTTRTRLARHVATLDVNADPPRHYSPATASTI